MESQSQINLKRFIPKKANKYYLLKIIFYVVLLMVLGTILLYVSNKTQTKNEAIKEIKGVQIEIE